MENHENQRDINKTSLPALEAPDLELDFDLADPVDEVELGRRLREFETNVDDLIAWLEADRMCTGPRPSMGKKTVWS
jgi:hypothetical protein